MAETADVVMVGDVVSGAFRPERFAGGRPIESPHPYAPRPDHVVPAR